MEFVSAVGDSLPTATHSEYYTLAVAEALPCCLRAK